MKISKQNIFDKNKKVFIFFIIILIFLYFKSPSYTNRYKVHLINCKHDYWKYNRLIKSMEDNNVKFDMIMWPCVLVDKNPNIVNSSMGKGYIKHVKNPNAKGNIGSALAHITLWEHIANDKSTKHHLVFEDNVLFKPNSEDFMETVSKFSDYDLFNLCSKRPLGLPTNTNGVLKVTSDDKVKNNFGKIANVLFSSYMITPTGARKVLNMFKSLDFDPSGTAIDGYTMSNIRNFDNINVYVIADKNLQYFGHVEVPCGGRSGSEDCDTRSKLNNGITINYN